MKFRFDPFQMHPRPIASISRSERSRVDRLFRDYVEARFACGQTTLPCDIARHFWRRARRDAHEEMKLIKALSAEL